MKLNGASIPRLSPLESISTRLDYFKGNESKAKYSLYYLKVMDIRYRVLFSLLSFLTKKTEEEAKSEIHFPFFSFIALIRRFEFILILEKEYHSIKNKLFFLER